MDQGRRLGYILGYLVDFLERNQKLEFLDACCRSFLISQDELTHAAGMPAS